MLFLGDFAVYNAPKHSAEVLSRVPKCKRFMMCLPEEIRALDKLHSSTHYSAAGCEFNVSQQYILKCV